MPAPISSPSPTEAATLRLPRQPSASGLILVDSRKRIRGFSNSAEHILGIREADALAREIKMLPVALRRVVDRVFNFGEPVEDRQVSFQSPSGEKTFHVTALPLVTGKPRSGVAVTLSAADPLRHFEQNIRRLDRLANVGLLSAGMAHEIKNALVSVKTFIDLLLDRNQDAELADVVGREMRRINSLVSQTLKYSGPSKPAFSAVRLHDVLDHSLRMVQPAVRTKVINVKRAFEAAPDMVRGDDYQLEQVFVNLFLNAVEATGTAGSLAIKTEAVPAGQSGVAKACVRVTISDTGSGIAPENMRRLFEPFFTTKQEGTGLGLAIARRIVEEHAGTIEARSVAGKGTEVSVLIPSHIADA